MVESIEVKNLSKIYAPTKKLLTQASDLIRAGDREAAATLPNTVVAVNDVSLNIRQGETFIVMGLSGSGKSTLIRCLNRLIEPTLGSISVEGEDVLAKKERQLRDFRRTKVAMVFQHFALLPHKTIHENVEYGLLIRGVNSKSRREKAVDALEMVGLGRWKDFYPDHLSGGMRQRVGLARALANEPDILLMDEPFSALDPLIRTDMQMELVALQKNLNKTIVFITHDFQEAVTLGNQIAIMKNGSVVQVGTGQQMLLNPADEYVSRFTRDLDRSKVLTAAHVMQRTNVVRALDHESDDDFRKKMNGHRYAFVLNEKEEPIGLVVNDGKAVLDARIGRDEHISDKYVRVRPDQRLYELFGAVEDAKPFAVISDEGKFLGHIDVSDIISSLAKTEPEHDRDGARVRPCNPGA